MPRRPARHVLAFAVLSAAGASCRTPTADPAETDLKIDSAHAKFFDLRVESAVVLVPTAPAGDEAATAAHYKEKANEHIRYGWLGQIKGWHAGSDFNREAVEVVSVGQPDNGLVELRYTLAMTLAWPKEDADPKDLHFVLPGRLDSEGTSALWDKFGKACSKEGSASYDSYDWRPTAYNCPLKDLTGASEAGVGLIEKDGVRLSRVPLGLTPKATTVGKKPEYDRLWQDKRLVATIVYAKDSGGSMDPSDIGTRDYASAYRKLVSAFGKPKTTSVPVPAEGLGPTLDDVTATWQLSGGRTLEARFFLIDYLSSIAEIQKRLDAGEEAGGSDKELRFLNAFRERTRTSEMTYYGGHSGVGRNIRALPVITRYVKGLYNIYALDGCNSYDYLDKALNEGVAAANPGQASSKFLDIVSNAYPASFGVEPMPVILLKALVAKSATYRQILAQMDQSQRAIVEGEEDNGAAFPY